MDQLNKSLSNVSLWEVKSYVRKAQNAVLNLSSIEAKVREATNNEPWGASNTLMSQIANCTFNYKDREDINNMIYRRFTEKSASEWRQIYKSLQLLEYLIKNGSERFVDDSISNISLIKMLKTFHYIDSKGVDQGINIRNRAKELVNLLSDEAKIREERKKAKENAKKFASVSSSSSRNYRHSNYSAPAASGDDYENRIFGDGGVYGQRYEETRTSTVNPKEFEEYDEEEVSGNGNGNAHSHGQRSSQRHVQSARTSRPTVSESTVNAKAQTPDLLSDLLDSTPTPSANQNIEEFDEEDDFDDFQSATPQPPSQSMYSQHTAPQQQFTAPPTSTYNAAPVTPAPAINQPKTDDIFGSLLQSAKQTSRVTSTSSRAPPAPTPTPTPNPAPSQTSNSFSNSTGVVDLLDL